MSSEGQAGVERENEKGVGEVTSAVSGMIKDVLVAQGDKIKVGQVVFTLEPGAPSQPHAQQASRADESHQHEQQAFQDAIQSEGRTEEEALPPDQPRTAPVATFSMPLDLDRAAGA